jgi:hypothetical protein
MLDMSEVNSGFLTGDLRITEDPTGGVFVVLADEIPISVYGCKLRHHNSKLLENIIAECRVKPPLDSIDIDAISYSTLFAYGSVRPDWDWERELFRDIALLSDTHLEKARINRLKRVLLFARQSPDGGGSIPEEIWQAMIQSTEKIIKSLEEQDYFGKDVSKIPPLEKFLKDHDLEHPQIMINEHPPEGRNQSERQARLLSLQVKAREANGRVIITPNGSVLSYIPGNDPETTTNLTNTMVRLWDGLTREQRDSVILLASKFHSQMLAILLVLGDCSPTEYAQSLLQSEGEGAHKEPNFGDNPSSEEQDVLSVRKWLDDQSGGRVIANMDDENVGRYNTLLADASIVTEYLKLCSNPILDLIKAGEKANVEFKSSFRWDIEQNQRNDKVIQGASLKTLVAFLNSDGGTLLVGVSDDGSVLGVEQDGYRNQDQYQRSIFSSISNRIGHEFVNAVSIRFHEIGSKELVSIECRSDQSVGNAFLDDDGYYVRQGPMSVPLNKRQMVEHIERKTELSDDSES